MVTIITIKKIKIHYTLYLLFFLSIIIGLFKEFILVFISFLFHELGHLYFLNKFKYQINKITIYPFGGVIDFTNKPDFIYRYFLVSIGGILANIVLLCFSIIFKLDVLFDINILFLLVNLIPIHPLDGAKILLSFLKLLFPVYYSKKTIYYFSVILSLGLFITIYYFYDALILFLFLIVFLNTNIYSIKNYNLEYHNFLLNRYMYPNKDLKEKKIKRFNEPIYHFYYGYNMIFDFDEFVISEEDVLNKYFKKKNESF